MNEKDRSHNISLLITYLVWWNYPFPYLLHYFFAMENDAIKAFTEGNYINNLSLMGNFTTDRK